MGYQPWGLGTSNSMGQMGQVSQPPPQQTGYTPYVGGSSFVNGPTGNMMPHQYYQPPPVNRQLPFLATLDLPDLSWLTNDPILHSPNWPTMLRKLPSNIPKFNGKPGEDPKSHVMNFHCWCCSNSLMDDSICLHLFQ